MGVDIVWFDWDQSKKEGDFRIDDDRTGKGKRKHLAELSTYVAQPAFQERVRVFFFYVLKLLSFMSRVQPRDTIDLLLLYFFLDISVHRFPPFVLFFLHFFFNTRPTCLFLFLFFLGGEGGACGLSGWISSYLHSNRIESNRIQPTCLVR